MYQRGSGIDHQPQVLFTSAYSFFGPLALGNLEVQFLIAASSCKVRSKTRCPNSWLRL